MFLMKGNIWDLMLIKLVSGLKISQLFSSSLMDKFFISNICLVIAQDFELYVINKEKQLTKKLVYPIQENDSMLIKVLENGTKNMICCKHAILSHGKLSISYKPCWVPFIFLRRLAKKKKRFLG